MLFPGPSKKQVAPRRLCAQGLQTAMLVCGLVATAATLVQNLLSNFKLILELCLKVKQKVRRAPSSGDGDGLGSPRAVRSVVV